MTAKPERPLDSDCCNSGCNPCIFDVYEDRLKSWEKNEEKGREIETCLSQLKYTPFYLSCIEVLNRNLLKYTFQNIKLNKKINGTLVRSLIPNQDFEFIKKSVGVNIGNHFILKGEYISSDDNKKEPISRPYTPILNKALNSQGCFEVIIKLYEYGKMSQFISGLKEEDIVFWRGPYGTFTYEKNLYKHVLLLGAGTGTVPLYNIAKFIVENEIEDVWVKLICCFQNIQEISLRKEINALKSFWNFDANIYLSEKEQNNEKKLYNENIEYVRLTKDIILNELKNLNHDKLLAIICGPTNFNNEFNFFMTDCNVKKIEILS